MPGTIEREANEKESMPEEKISEIKKFFKKKPGNSSFCLQIYENRF